MGKRAHKPGTDRVGKHLGVYRNQFEKWMDGLMEWEATGKQCPASITGNPFTDLCEAGRMAAK